MQDVAQARSILAEECTEGMALLITLRYTSVLNGSQRETHWSGLHRGSRIRPWMGSLQYDDAYTPSLREKGCWSVWWARWQPSVPPDDGIL